MVRLSKVLQTQHKKRHCIPHTLEPIVPRLVFNFKRSQKILFSFKKDKKNA